MSDCTPNYPRREEPATHGTTTTPGPVIVQPESSERNEGWLAGYRFALLHYDDEPCQADLRKFREQTACSD